MSDSPKAPVTLLNSVSAPNRERLEQIHSRCLALGAAADKDLGREAAAELAGFVYELIQMPIARKAIAEIPANPLCVAEDALGTLHSAHAMMELVEALDCNEGTSQLEMPETGRGSVARLRTLVQDSIKYAADLYEVAHV
jgi:hypothetical protein